MCVGVFLHVCLCTWCLKKPEDCLKLKLQILGNCCVGDGNRIQVLCEMRQCSWPLSHLSSPIAFIVNKQTKKQKNKEKIGLWSEVYCVIHLNTVCLRGQLGEERVNFTLQLVHHPGKAGQEPGGRSRFRGHGRCCFPGLLGLLSYPFRTTLWARPLLINC